jgi:hypothetical protein
MVLSEYHQRVFEHVREFFAGHDVRSQPFDGGPIQRVLPGFHTIQVGPGPRLGQTTYVSVGAGFPDDGDEHLEFVAVASSPSARHVELLAMTSYYHRSGERLGLGHTFPIGEPWVPGSSLDHFLVSLPYPFGPQLEHLPMSGHNVRLLWLLPIASSERDYKRAHGVEALETLFDAAQIAYWDPKRRPVVPKPD